MGMRKIFRMQYEPCSGACYQYDDDDSSSGGGGGSDTPDIESDILPLRALRFDQVRLKSIMEKLVAMHQELCGNKNIRYGIDLDEDNQIFIGSFWHYGKLELFTDRSHLKLIEKMAEYVLAFYQTEAYHEESKHNKGVGHDVCEHGEDDDLRRFIIRTAKIPTPNGVDAYLREMGIAV